LRFLSEDLRDDDERALTFEEPRQEGLGWDIIFYDHRSDYWDVFQYLNNVLLSDSNFRPLFCNAQGIQVLPYCMFLCSATPDSPHHGLHAFRSTRLQAAVKLTIAILSFDLDSRQSYKLFKESETCQITHLFSSTSSHSLEALLVRLVNLRDLEVILLELLDQLGSIELAVAATGLDDFGLLLEREVLPGEVWADVFLKEGENLVVGDCAWVGEVVDAGLFVLGEKDGGGQEIVKDGVRVGDVDNTLVLGDLSDEVAGVEVIGDRHTESEDETVAVVLHDLRTCWLMIYEL
jgi:hypothetical protein